MSGADRIAWRFVAAMAAVTLVAVAIWVVPTTPEIIAAWLPLLILTATTFVATMSPPRLPWLPVTLAADTLPIVVAAAIYGPGAAMVVGVIGSVVPRHLAHGKYRAFTFNRANIGVASALAGVAYETVTRGLHAPGLVTSAAGLVAAIAVIAVVNAILMAMYLALTQQSRFQLEAVALLRHLGMMCAGALLLGPLVLVLDRAAGASGLVLLVIPVVGANLLVGRHAHYTQAFMASVDSLVTALGVKDRGTLEHSRRVGAYAAQIARQMRLSTTQQKVMYYNGLLHDVGKLGVCDEILKKPALFTADEYEKIKVHAQLGERLTAPFWGVDRTIRGMNYVSYHHERWDGRGYPRGLKGESIPLGGRILAVADAFDAMTSDRPYHKAVPADQAYVELIRCAGVQFDPQVVRAFLEAHGVDIPASYDRRVVAQELMADRRGANAGPARVIPIGS